MAGPSFPELTNERRKLQKWELDRRLDYFYARPRPPFAGEGSDNTLVFDPTTWPGVIGAFDFTNPELMFVERTSPTTHPNVDDPVGYVLNLVPDGPDIASDTNTQRGTLVLGDDGVYSVELNNEHNDGFILDMTDPTFFVGVAVELLDTLTFESEPQRILTGPSQENILSVGDVTSQYEDDIIGGSFQNNRYTTNIFEEISGLHVITVRDIGLDTRDALIRVDGQNAPMLPPTNTNRIVPISRIGYRNTQTPENALRGRLRRLVVMNRPPTAAETEAIERWLGTDIVDKPIELPEVPVTSMWTGALTDSSITISADVALNVPAILEVTTDEDTNFTSPVFAEQIVYNTVSKSGNSQYYIAKTTVTGLQPNTKYRFRFNSPYPLTGAKEGTFRTAPQKGVAAPFKFAFSSCSRYQDENDLVAPQGILADEPLFFIHLGDISYDDYTGTSRTTKRGIFYRQYLSWDKVQELHQHVPTAYIWSDHDSTGNDLHRGSTISGTTYDDIIATAQEVYQEGVPHYPLQVEGTLFQTFWIGKCFFILGDPMSTRDLTEDQETALGEEQFNAIVAAVEQAVSEGATLVFYGDGMTWIDRSSQIGKWANWREEQTALLDALRAIPGMPKLIVLCGDTHALGADDGTNCDFSTNGMDIQHFQAAPLRQSANTTGGPFSWLEQDTYNATNNRAYAIVEVNEDNTHVKVTFKARNDGDSLPEVVAVYNTEDLLA